MDKFTLSSQEIEKYGVEWLILELVAAGCSHGARKDEFIRLFQSTTIKWGKLIEKAIEHKLLALLFWTILNNHLENLVPPKIIKLLKLQYDYTKIKQEIYGEEALRIAIQLETAKVPYVMTKGLILNSELYTDSGCRDMNDIDFIVDPTYQNDMKTVLKQLGYSPGYMDIQNDKIIRFTREEQILCSITKNKMLGHVKPIKNPVVHCVYVGVDFSLTWSDSVVQIPIEYALKKRKKYTIGKNREGIFSFTPDMHFIYIALHLLKHAWSESLQLSKDSCNLTQFADIYRFWNTYSQEFGIEIQNIIQELNIPQIIGWVVGHTDKIFHSSLIEELGLNKYIDEEWLHTRITTRGKKLNIQESVRDMLSL